MLQTDSYNQITVDSLKNPINLNRIIEEIWQRLRSLKAEEWYVEFSRTKANMGNFKNEITAHLAKQAVLEEDAQISYNKIPSSVVQGKGAQ